MLRKIIVIIAMLAVIALSVYLYKKSTPKTASTEDFAEARMPPRCRPPVRETRSAGHDAFGR